MRTTPFLVTKVHLATVTLWDFADNCKIKDHINNVRVVEANPNRAYKYIKKQQPKVTNLYKNVVPHPIGAGKEKVSSRPKEKAFDCEDPSSSSSSKSDESDGTFFAKFPDFSIFEVKTTLKRFPALRAGNFQFLV